MAPQAQTCPICQGPVEAGAAACPRCGFKLIGATEAFRPVSLPSEQTSEANGGSTPVLKVTKGPYAGQKFTMGEGTFTIGRDPSCDLFLSNMTVSRHHATIEISGDAAKIIDAGSTNGTWVDGHVVDAAPLRPGSCIQIGTFEMRFEHTRA